MSFRAERRQSVAERRPSTSYTPEVIPRLTGLEKPQEMGLKISSCDVLIVGTGIVESMLAAALSWQGVEVLHVDGRPYYGDASSTLTVEQLKKWCEDVNGGAIPHFSNAQIYVESQFREHKSKDYGIDLSPKILFAQSDMLSLLIKSRVYKYLEFQSLSNFHMFEHDDFQTRFSSASTKEEIFTDKSLSLLTKRSLMKFLKFVLTDDTAKVKTLAEHAKTPVDEFLRTQFRLEPPQITELIYSIGLCLKPSTNTPEAVARIKRFLVSFDVYGNFPAMVSKYGGPGEVSQGFCRSAAVAGTTFKLNTSLVDYDPVQKVAQFSDKSRVKINEKVVVSPTQIPKFLQSSYADVTKNLTPVILTRLVVVVKKDCKEWMSDSESSAMVVFPPGSLPVNNTKSIQVLIQNGGSGVCPAGQAIWYLTSFEQDNNKAKQDLHSAFEKLENTLLRESSQELPEVLGESSVTINGDSVMVNSFKLGKSLQNFVPKEKLEIICKFAFTQKTFVAEDLSNILHATVENNVSLGHSKDCADIIFTNMPAGEISYDGVVSDCKILYSRITGSDDDFFDVDFEDEDESFSANGFHQQASTSGSKDKSSSILSDNENAIASSDDEHHEAFGADAMEL